MSTHDRETMYEALEQIAKAGATMESGVGFGFATSLARVTLNKVGPQTPPDRMLVCDHACGFTSHRFRPSPEAGPYWRCSECGEITEPAPEKFARHVRAEIGLSPDDPDEHVIGVLKVLTMMGGAVVRRLDRTLPSADVQSETVDRVDGRLGGDACIEDTRITVAAVLALLAAGHSIDRVAELYEVSVEQVSGALRYATTALTSESELLRTLALVSGHLHQLGQSRTDLCLRVDEHLHGRAWKVPANEQDDGGSAT